MKRFLGLFKKEWQIHYKWLIATCIVCIGTTVGIPFLIKKYLNSPIQQGSVTFIMAILVSFFTFLIVCIHFFTNLKRELQHADIWLHTTTPFYQLIGAKGFFSLLTGIILTLLMSIEAIIVVSTESDFSLVQQIKFVFGMIFLSMNTTFCLLPITLVMFACYVKLKKWLGKFSLITVIILFFGILYVFNKIMNSTLYSELFLSGMKSSGWIDSSIEPIAQIYDTTFIMDDIYLREDLLSIFINVLIIIVGIKWCKKVVKE